MLLCLALAGCDQDVFGSGYRRIEGRYYLNRWEDGKTFYIVYKENGLVAENGGGVVDGNVTHLGWRDKFIVVKRNSMFRGDPDGWMIINSTMRTVSGPFSDYELGMRPEIKGVSVYTAAEAWERLR